MTLEELLAVAEIVEKLTNRYRDQAALHRERFVAYDKLLASMNADHETKMVEHRAAFGARTEADAKIIAGLRAEIDSLKREELATNETLKPLVDRVVTERDALRAEVAALQERLRASIARGDFAQMEVAALKSQSPHPVKVGDWVRRTKLPGAQSPVGIVKQVTVIRCDGDSYGFADGDFWSVDNCEPCTHQHPAQDGQWVRRTVASGTEPVGTMIQVQRSRTRHEEYVTRGEQVVPWAHCEPCDPPIVKREPTIGDTVRLVKIPIMGAVSPELQRVLEWPWIERWGTLNQTALVVEPAYQLEGALSVCLRTNVHVRWPVCCIEVVSEATHDTEAGKATAESALKTELVADEIKVGDVVEVFKSSSTWTFLDDIGKSGTVSKIETDVMSERIVHLSEHPDDAFALRDVRKVMT